MDSSSCRSSYIYQSTEGRGLSQESIQPLQSIWHRIAALEAKTGKTLEDGYTKSEYIDLFNALSTFDRVKFRSYKSIVKKYIEYLVSQGILGEQSISEIVSVEFEDIDASQKFENRYFKDFAELQEKIDEALIAADRHDNRVFAMQITAIYLAWCGVTIDEALMLKKSDVHEDDIQVGDRVVRPNKTIMKFIQAYRDETEYDSRANNIITLKFIPSQWLFRTTRSDHVDNTRSLRICINTFGNEAGADGNLFNYNKIYLSGVFHRAYLYELENGKIPYGNRSIINQAFQKNFDNNTKANLFLKQYWQFVDNFFPSK